MSSLVKINGVKKAQEVEPLKNIKDITKIKTYLKGKDDKRDYTIFVVGINVGLRASDLLKLTVGAVKNSDGSIKDSVTIVEQKTSKTREFNLNKSCKDALTIYLRSYKTLSKDDYLFPSRKGGHLTVKALHRIISDLIKDLNIKGNYGTHTLQRILNHSTAAMTLRYIGITKEVIDDVYDIINN